MPRCFGLTADASTARAPRLVMAMMAGVLGLLLATPALAQVPAPFVEHFADNSNIWLFDPEWEIGPATSSTGHVAGNPDPAADFTPTSDNGVAGMVIGGNVSTVLHGFYYLTSPAVDTTALSSVTLRFMRWLNMDEPSFMRSRVEVWDGSFWVVLWEASNITDSTWTPQSFDISAYSNSQLKVRFGLSVDAADAYELSGWNLDDVEIGVPPTVLDPTSASVTQTEATLGGNVTATGGAAITARGVVYAPTATNSSPVIGGTGVTTAATSGTTGVFTVDVTGLSPGTAYSFAAYAANANTTGYSEFAEFTTLAAPPDVSAPTIAALSGTSATLGGDVTSDNGSLITERGVVYSLTATNPDPLIGGSGVTVAASDSCGCGPFIVDITGLSASTAYSFKAYATNAAGTGYSAVSGFTTLGTADLFDLMLSRGTLSPAFDPAVFSYATNVGRAVSSLLVTPIQADPSASLRIRVNGGAFQNAASGVPSAPLSLAVGANSVEVEVTGQGGSPVQTYAITVTRAPALIAGEAEPGFRPDVNGAVFATAVQPDGRIVIGGQFTRVQGVDRNNVARLNPDGTLDPTFDPNADNSLSAIAIQANGKIVVAGDFTTIGGEGHVQIARLNPDGTPDSGFNPQVDNVIRTLAIQDDGRILLGGEFNSVNTDYHPFLARLETDGSLDLSFAPGMDQGVKSIAVQTDGGLVIGGAFTIAGGDNRNRIARLNANGTLDLNFNPDANGAVLSVVLQEDGKIVIGGDFTQVSGEARSRLARLNADGTLDLAYDPGADNSVFAQALQADGRILVGGTFGVVGGAVRHSIARLNADGTLDTGFDPDASAQILNIALQANGKILVGGYFTVIGGESHPSLARLENGAATQSLAATSASRVEWLRGGSSPESSQVTFEWSTDGGASYSPPEAGARISGGFELTGLSLPSSGHLRARARLSGGQHGGSTGLVESIAAFGAPDVPEVAVSGNGADIPNGNSAPDPADHTDFGSANLADQAVVRTFTISNAGTGNLGVGTVTVSGAHPADFVVSAQPDASVAFSTTFQVTFQPGGVGLRTAALSFANSDADEDPFSFAIQGTGVVSNNADLADLAPGSGVLDPAFDPSITDYKVGVAFGINLFGLDPVRADPHATVQVRLNGGAWAIFGPGYPNDPLPLSLGENAVEVKVTAQDGTTTKTYSLSVFRAAPSVGDLDPDFNPFVNSTVFSTSVQPDGKIVVGTDGVQRFNADGSLDIGFNPLVNDSVYSTAVQADGKILIGGSFDAVNVDSRDGLARLNPDGTLDAAFNPPSGEVLTVAVQPDGRILYYGDATGLVRVNEDGTADTGFSATVDGPVYSVALAPDGKILIGGDFSTVGLESRGNLARLNADGTVDASFNIITNGPIDEVLLQPDGKVLLGGEFTTVGGTARHYLARLNANGTLDAGFNPDADDWVYSMALQADGKIVIGGFFTTIGDSPRSFAARLNPDGTLDEAFHPDVDAWVWSTALQADGQILLGGDFFSVGGAPVFFLARLKNDDAAQRLTVPGSDRVEWLRAGSSPESPAVTFELSTDSGATYSALGDGTRIAGGWELTGQSLPGSGQVRARARTLGGLSAASGGLVESIALIGAPAVPEISVSGAGIDIANGDLTPSLADQTNFGPAGVPSETVVRTFTIRNGGTADLTVDSVLVSGPGAGDFTVTLQPASPVLFSRTFQVSFDPSTVGVRQATLTFTNGDADESPFTFAIQGTGFIPSSNADLDDLILSSGTLAPIFATSTRDYTATVPFSVATLTVTPTPAEPHAGVEIRINGGGYQTVPPGSPSSALSLVVGENTIEVHVIAQDLLADATYSIVVTRGAPVPGELDPLFDAALLPGGLVSNTTLQPDGAIVIGIGTVPDAGIGGVARLGTDGTLDLPSLHFSNHTVESTAVQDDGRIVLAGAFTTVDGNSHNYAARLNTDLSTDEDFDLQVDGEVHSLSVQADGKILVGGAFTHAGGQSIRRLARFHADGILDGAFHPNPNDVVYAAAIQSDGKILLGGLFTMVGSTTRNHLARLNADGTLDTGFNPNVNGEVRAIAVQADGKILLSGPFTEVGAQPREWLARLDTSGALDLAFQPAMNGAVRSLAIQADGQILLVGDFTEVEGETRNRIARLAPDGALDPDFDPNASGPVYGTALQADGRVLVSGLFSNVAGTTRNSVARLENSAPTGSLTVPSLDRVQWLRGGSAPETSQVTFELSTDGGSTYDPLGPGTRISGGWELTGQSLPLTGQIRARARTTAGHGNGSTGLVETVASFTIVATAPVVTSPTSASVLGTTATLGGTVASDGGSAVTARGIVYALTSANSNPSLGGIGVTFLTTSGTIGVFTVNATGLNPSGAYSFKAYATNAEGTSYSGVATFNTLAGPTVTSPVSSSITTTSASMGGDVTADGGSAITGRGVVYSATATNSNPLIGGTGVTTLAAAGTTGTFTVGASGLTAATGYSFRAYVTTAIATSYTTVATFTTLGTVPTVISPASTAIAATSATLGGNVSSDGGSAVVSRGVVYSATATNANPQIGGTGVTQVTAAGTTGVFTVGATILAPVTGYSFRAYATNAVGTSYTTFATFTTLATAPTVAAPTISSLTSTGAVLGASVTSDGGSAITERGFVYASNALNPNPLIGGVSVVQKVVAGTTGTFSSSLTSLPALTTYVFKAYAKNAMGTTYGPLASFTTLGLAPAATTGAASALSASGASLAGVVNPNGLATTAVFEYGVRATYGAQQSVSSSPGSGLADVGVTATLTGLGCGTTYHYRLKATNSQGDTNGADATFTTLACQGISIDDPDVAEGGASKSILAFTISLSAASTADVTVNYATSDGTAFAGSDYTAASGVFTIPAGVTSKRIAILVSGDADIEADETFTLTLSNAVGATIGKSAGSGAILNDDAAVAATPVTQYRLYHPGTLEHLYTTDLNEYNVLGTFGWIQEGLAYKMLTNGLYSGAATVPLFRLYHPGILQHHWTTDSNEAAVLAATPFWYYEGTVGYLLPTPVAGAVPLYRMALASPALHLWTTDQNEYDTLATRGWVKEGIIGYVIP